MTTQTKEAQLKANEDLLDKIGGKYDVPYSLASEAINACKEALKPHPNCDEACMFQCEMERKQSQEQEPLSNETVRAEFRVYVDTNLDVDDGFRFVDFLEGVRYAEKAHGIWK